MSAPGFEKGAALQPEAPRLPPLSASSVVGRAIADVVSAFGVTLLLALPVILIWLTLSKGDKATLSVQTPPVALIAFLALLQESQFAVFGWRRFRKNRSEGRRSASQSNGRYAPKSRAVFLGIASGAGLIAFSQLISPVIPGKSPVGIVELVSGLRTGPWTAAGVLVLIAAVAPVCEEILFRGAIFGLAHANGRTWTGAIMASVLFAIAHLSLRLTPYYLVFSAVNCWLLARTRTLAGPIAAHVTVNFSACMAVLFGVRI
ncbi:MAG TPA: CPBP family intramembrane glutamic endopeptidase [Bryobacteraceae bacterium]